MLPALHSLSMRTEALLCRKLVDTRSQRPNIQCLMRFGFHVSIAGGFSQVAARAKKLGCQTMQLFTRSPRGWQARPLDKNEAAQFRRDVAESDISPVFVHAPYLPNLATGNTDLGQRTIELLVEEAKRCRLLGIGYLIVHMGKAGGDVSRSGSRKPATGNEKQIARALELAAKRLNRVLNRSPETVTVLLENTAGMGTEVGCTFEQVAAIIEKADGNDRLGVVLDTAHLFEAGYELRNRRGIDDTLRRFDREVGLSRLHLLHLNDSRTGLGSRKDRHWHIGKGEIGQAGFRAIVNHPLLAHLPGIMETPRRSPADDRANMRTLLRLTEKGAR